MKKKKTEKKSTKQKQGFEHWFDAIVVKPFKRFEVYSLLYIYIYIYCQSLADCFALSELFSVAWHVGLLKAGSKLYVKPRLRPLGQHAYHVG